MIGDDATQRREVLYWGEVQGVGFRFTVHGIAQAHQVFGFVKNLADGRVQVVAEGTPAELDRFFVAVEDQLRHNIHGLETNAQRPTGGHDDFEIAF